MVCNSPELSLDLSPPPAAYRCIPDFLTRFPVSGIWDDLTKLNDFIDRLQNELTKIQAFERELPLSALLVNDAIGKLKEEARRRQGKLDESVGVKLGNDKKTWMSSAQLWSPRNGEDDRSQEQGAFMSFREEDSGIPAREEEDDIPRLSLLTPGFGTPAEVEPGSRGGVFTGPGFYTTAGQAVQPQTKSPLNQTARKLRRCWSPDLHQRFVDALEQLGGSQVATPKQIRELMQVDGLTNDEVKSHLQKYRIHVRKLSSSGSSLLSSNDASTSRTRAHGLGYSKGDLPHTCSPEGPLHLARHGKCNSTSMEEDEDEEKSDGHSWKGEQRM